jgi:hypothetical protein
MIKLVNFLKINFILIIISFFLPFFPFFSCENKKIETASADSALTVIERPADPSNRDTSMDTISVSEAQTSSLTYDTTSNKIVKENDDRLTNRVLNYLSLTKYITEESNISITGFGMLVIFCESDMSDKFEWGNYLLPISFLTCVLGLIGSIKSKRRKHQFLFVCSLTGLSAITTIGFMVNNLGDLLFGFWIVLVLYLVNTLLSFILWKNYFIKDKEGM